MDILPYWLILSRRQKFARQRFPRQEDFYIGRISRLRKIPIAQLFSRGYNHTNSMGKERFIPDEVFHSLAAIIPRLLRAANELVHLEADELYVLWFIGHFGEAADDGRMMYLRHKLTDLLVQELGYRDTKIFKIINGLFQRGLVDKGTLTEADLVKVFHATGGRSAVIILEPSGGQKIEEFKDTIDSLFRGALQKQSCEIPGAMPFAEAAKLGSFLFKALNHPYSASSKGLVVDEDDQEASVDHFPGKLSDD